jgi:hypothetical protein
MDCVLFANSEKQEILIDLHVLRLHTNIEHYYDAKFGVDNWMIIDKITVSKYLGSFTREKYVFFVRDGSRSLDHQSSLSVQSKFTQLLMQVGHSNTLSS